MRFRIVASLLIAFVLMQATGGAYAQNDDFKALLGKDFSTCLNPTDPKYDAKVCEKLTSSSNDILKNLLGGKNSLMQSAKDCTPGVELSKLIKGCTKIIANPFMIPKGKAEASVIRGGAFLQAKNYPLAVKDADAALSYGGFPGEAHFLKGAALFAMGNYSKSITHFSEAISTPPKSVTLDLIYRSRGVAKRKAGFLTSALEDFNTALKRSPGDMESYLHRGLTYGALFQYDKAIADFDQAQRIKPDVSEVLLARGEVYAALYQFKKALFDYKKVSNRTISRPDAEALKAISHVGRGMVYVFEGVNG